MGGGRRTGSPLLLLLGWSLVATVAAWSGESAPPLEAFFAPYDASTSLGGNLTVLQTDIKLITTVTRAKQAFDAAQGADDKRTAEGAFAIQFCVYNLLDASYVDPLIAAFNAGVSVQVLMDYGNLEQKYVPTYEWFKNASLRVAPQRNMSQKDLTPAQRSSLNLIGIKTAGLMHMKMRYFSWLASPVARVPTEVVVSGSFNPEDGALRNEDTLLVVRDAPTIAAYRRAYAAVRDGAPFQNSYDAARPINLLFSQAQPASGGGRVAAAGGRLGGGAGGGWLVRDTLLDLVRNETELIILSVYSLRNVADEDGTLVDELCAAARRGVGVAVLVDKGQADGESGFAGGDSSLTALQLWKRCRVPVYKCENYAGKYNALHHKNALFGATSARRVVWTDTANWSGASMGNGTSHAKPHNAETVMVVASGRLDKGRIGLRFLSNALQLIRKYSYQQACPYTRPDGKSISAQCGTDMKWNQPDWAQPPADEVLRALVAKVGTAWPMVETTFTIDGKAGGQAAPTLRYRVNGEAHEHEVRMSRHGVMGWQAKVPRLPFGAMVAVRVAALGAKTEMVADAAFDWSASPPIRRPGDQLDAMRIHVHLEADVSDAPTRAKRRASRPLAARDGFGNVVDWFLVIKTPQATFPAAQVDEVLAKYGALGVKSLNISRTDHCTCSDPECPASANTSVGIGRGSGLCYLYADSNNSTLRWYTEVTETVRSGADATMPRTLGCLGQGGNDPISWTLRQLNGLRDSSDVEWAYWNDQYEGLSDSQYSHVCGYSAYSNESLPYKTCTNATGAATCGKRCKHFASGYRPCSSDADCTSGDACEQIQCKQRALPHWGNICGSPDAHAKGALAFRRDSTGFYLQSTTPNFPDPSLTSIVGTPGFGCQLSDNTKFGQSFFGMTLKASTFRDVLGPTLGNARLCSTGTNSCARGKAGHIGDWMCTSEHTRGSDWSMLDRAFTGNSTAFKTSTSALLHTAAAEALAEEEAFSTTERAQVPGHARNGGGDASSAVIHLVVKAESDEIPPWLLTASEIGTDLAVSSWLENGYGGPSICKSDDYSRATRQGCVVDRNVSIELSRSGGAAYSVENALAASIDINGQGRAWGLWGDLGLPITSHAKFAVGSSRPWFISGDMNQQGWPCSKACNGSQLGRGGTFLGIYDEALHSSVVDRLHLVCACDTASQSSSRFCNFGCFQKQMSSWDPTPPTPKQTTSSWDSISWGRANASKRW